MAQRLAVGVEVRDGEGRDSALHRRAGHGGGQMLHQTRVERLGDQILGAELELMAAIGLAHDVRRLGHGQIGDGAHAGCLHRLVDFAGTAVQRAAEDEGEAEDVVDLIRIIRAPGGDDGIGAGRAREIGHDLGDRVGERHDDRRVRHAGQPVRLQHPGRRQAQEDVRPLDHLLQRAVLGLDRIAALVLVHLLRSPLIDDSRDVGEGHVFLAQAELDQQIHARQGGGAGTRGHQARLADVLADHPQPVEDRRRDHDRGAVLVVMEDRDPHALLERPLDDETLRGLDVFQIDGAEGGFEPGHGLDEGLRIALLDLDVEHIEIGELLEQHRLAFHDRLGGQSADGAQTQHGGAVGDDRDQVAARGVVRGVERIFFDLAAGGGDARRIGQGQIALIGERLGRLDLQLAGFGVAVVVECALVEFVRHLDLRR